MILRIFATLILLTTIFFLAPPQSMAQDYKAQFQQLFQEKEKDNDVATSSLLKKWEAAKPKDPELYIAYFNYYFSKSKKEVIALEKKQKRGESMAVYNTDSTGGKPVAFLNSEISYERDNFQQGMEYINKAIELFPSRLDMRFGKIYALGLAHDHEAFTKEVVSAINYNATIKSKWLWEDSKSRHDGEAFFLGGIQNYVNTLYDAGDTQLPNMRKISEAVLHYYPNHVESLSNVAITYMIGGDLDSGLPYLLKAEKASPNDVVVLNNIAECYSRKHDNTNAKIYYNKIIKVGTKDDIELAKEQLKSLK